MTPAQQCFAEGFAALLEQHGQTWVRSGDNAKIVALASAVVPGSPKMPQTVDREEAIVIADAVMSPPLLASQVMPNTRVTKGDELTKGQKYYRVSRADFREATCTWLVVVAPTF